jgi:catechol 2,3-dioxygenase
MALNGILRPGYIRIRVTDIDAALRHYVDRIGLHEVSRGPDGRVYLRAWDEFDRHSIVLRPAETPGMDYVGFKVASLSRAGSRPPEQRSRRCRPASSRGSGGG